MLPRRNSRAKIQVGYHDPVDPHDHGASSCRQARRHPAEPAQKHRSAIRSSPHWLPLTRARVGRQVGILGKSPKWAASLLNKGGRHTVLGGTGSNWSGSIICGVLLQSAVMKLGRTEISRFDPSHQSREVKSDGLRMYLSESVSCFDEPNRPRNLSDYSRAAGMPAGCVTGCV